MLDCSLVTICLMLWYHPELVGRWSESVVNIQTKKQFLLRMPLIIIYHGLVWLVIVLVVKYWKKQARSVSF